MQSVTCILLDQNNNQEGLFNIDTHVIHLRVWPLTCIPFTDVVLDTHYIYGCDP